MKKGEKDALIIGGLAAVGIGGYVLWKYLQGGGGGALGSLGGGGGGGGFGGFYGPGPSAPPSDGGTGPQPPSKDRTPLVLPPVSYNEYQTIRQGLNVVLPDYAAELASGTAREGEIFVKPSFITGSPNTGKVRIL